MRPLLTLQGGSAASSVLTLSHHSAINLPLEPWAIITIAEHHSFASHGPFLSHLKPKDGNKMKKLEIN